MLSDVAISAPYENDSGAVYIFLGGWEGLSKNYAQVISPENFNIPSPNKVVINGFGFSISKAVDVDDNSHNGKYLHIVSHWLVHSLTNGQLLPIESRMSQFWWRNIHKNMLLSCCC